MVGNHMDLQPRGLSRHEVCQEGDELFGGVPVSRLAQHFARLGIEGGVQRQGAVSVVFKPMAFRPSRRQGPHRILAIQGLDRRLLIDAKHRRMLRGFR